MKNHLYLLAFVLIYQSSNLSAQCPPPWFPPIGDSCPTAPPFCDDINGYCGTLPFENITQNFPACPANVLNNDDWFVFVAGSDTLTLNIKPSNCLWLNGQSGMQAAIYEEGCNGIPVAVQCICTEQPFTLSAATVPGVNYYLVLDGCAGDVCDYEIEVQDGSTFPVPPPGFTPDGPGFICLGQEAIYTIPLPGSGASYQWTMNPPNAGVFNSYPIGNSVIFEPWQSGMVEICVQGTNGCSLSSSVGCLTVNVQPVSQTTEILSVCEGECIDTLSTIMCSPGTYEVTLTNTFGCDSVVIFHLNSFPLGYGFAGEFELPCDGSFEIDGQVFTELGDQYYFLFDPNGCDSLILLTILPGDVIADAGPNKVIGCAAQPVELQGEVLPTDVTSFVWETVDGNFVSGQNTLNPLVDQPGTYCLTATNDTSGCIMINCVYVIVNTDLPLIDFPEIAVPCDGNPIEICAEVDVFSGADFNWTTIAGNIVDTNDECVTIDLPAEYCLTVTNPNSCDSTLCVEVFSELSVTIDAPDRSCPGALDTIRFTVENSAEATTILYWQYGNGIVSQDTMNVGDDISLFIDQLNFLQDVVVTAWAEDENSCTSDTVTATIVSDAPNVTFAVTQGACGEATVEAIYPGNAISYTWGNGVQGPILMVNDDSIYEITIEDAGGCMVVQSIFVVLDFTGSCAYLEGTVNQDLMGSCSPSANTSPLAGWTVVATGTNNDYFATTAPDGTYFLPVEPGAYTVTVFSPSNAWDVCQNNVAVTLPDIGAMQVVDFLVKKSADCPIMQVDITSSLLRICQDNLFAVQYCNLGTVTATDAYIDVTLDDLLIFQNATVGFQDLGNNVIRFPVGDVDANECGNFLFRTQVDCNAPLGFVHCSEAHIFPDTSCVEPDPQWSGAALEVIGECDGETRFTITNRGDGDMVSPLTYRNYRNTAIYMFSQESPLAMGESRIINLPADGAAWRIEVDQDPFYPFASVGVSTVQSCTPSGVENIVNSLVNNMYLADQDNFLDEDCRPNVASFDPNLKMGSPKGYDVEGFIPDGTAIEYYIQFQNTGMDTAFSVVVRDTLSNLLDISTLRMGASSHPYTYQLLGNGILKIDFPNIELPHKAVDEAGSIGFIEFKISTKKGLAPLTKIENDASIYFDYNEPVKTNTSFHTIEKPTVHSYQEIESCYGDLWNNSPLTLDTIISESFSFPLYDSMAWTSITVNLPIDTTIYETLCAGQFFEFYGETYGAGTYEQTVPSFVGCDTNFTIIIVEEPLIQVYLAEELCVGGTFQYNGDDLKAPGEYMYQFTASTGCDSTVYLELTPADSIIFILSDQFCAGSSFEFNGQILDSPGRYEALLTTADGCDSLIVLELVETQGSDISLQTEICKGDIYEFNGEELTEEGNYEAQLTSIDGCDSLVTLSLTVWAVYDNERAATICHGDSAEFNGEFYYESGIYSEAFTSIHGCDSTETLGLTILDSLGSDFSTSICEGESIDFYGEILTEAGTYQTVLSSVAGCDSMVTLFLEVEPVYEDTSELTIVHGEPYDGILIFNDTTFLENFIAQNGCDSIVTTNITVTVNTLENLASEIQLSIFPNPTDGRFYLQFILRETQNVEVKIFDLIGRQVVFASQNEVYQPSEHLMEINSEKWASGIYFVHFQMENGVATGRVVVH